VNGYNCSTWQAQIVRAENLTAQARSGDLSIQHADKKQQANKKEKLFHFDNG
jgi:hypothetical protein